MHHTAFDSSSTTAGTDTPLGIDDDADHGKEQGDPIVPGTLSVQQGVPSDHDDHDHDDDDDEDADGGSGRDDGDADAPGDTRDPEDDAVATVPAAKGKRRTAGAGEKRARGGKSRRSTRPADASDDGSDAGRADESEAARDGDAPRKRGSGDTRRGTTPRKRDTATPREHERFYRWLCDQLPVRVTACDKNARGVHAEITEVGAQQAQRKFVYAGAPFTNPTSMVREMKHDCGIKETRAKVDGWRELNVWVRQRPGDKPSPVLLAEAYPSKYRIPPSAAGDDDDHDDSDKGTTHGDDDGGGGGDDGGGAERDDTAADDDRGTGERKRLRPDTKRARTKPGRKTGRPDGDDHGDDDEDGDANHSDDGGGGGGRDDGGAAADPDARSGTRADEKRRRPAAADDRPQRRPERGDAPPLPAAPVGVPVAAPVAAGAHDGSGTRPDGRGGSQLLREFVAEARAAPLADPYARRCEAKPVYYEALCEAQRLLPMLGKRQLAAVGMCLCEYVSRGTRDRHSRKRPRAADTPPAPAAPRANPRGHADKPRPDRGGKRPRSHHATAVAADSDDAAT